METNGRLERLGENPFTRLNQLIQGVSPPAGLKPLILSIGEPQHAPPPILADTIAAHADLWNQYPPVQGTPDFKAAVAAWLTRRYHLPPGLVEAQRHVLALCGTKEGLYLAVQMAVPESKAGRRPVVLLPNPFYQVYVGAAAMSGAEPVGLPATRETGFLPDFEAVPRELLERTAFAFLCNPSNPQGAIAPLDYLKRALTLARRYGFVLAVDECYSEIYDRLAPPGALEAAAALGHGLDNLLVFHSLSKRSNAAGLRAGFVAGDERLIRPFQTLRSYGGPQMSLPIQAAAAALWRDEAHVEENRARYRSKIDVAERVLAGRHGFYRPEGGFFLWLEVGDSVGAALRLWRDGGVKVLPGAFLATPDAAGRNPGAPFIRVALVHDDATIAEALERLVGLL